MGQQHGANGENRNSFSFAFQRLRPSTADGIALGPAFQPFFSGLGQKLMAQGAKLAGESGRPVYGLPNVGGLGEK